MTILDIDAIKKREAAATPGPWTLDEPYEVDDKGTQVTFINGPEWWYDGGLIESQSDADFIAAAREDVPRLIAEVERLREWVKTTQECAAERIKTAGEGSASVIRNLLDQNEALRASIRDCSGSCSA